jgi:hypothetical protein
MCDYSMEHIASRAAKIGDRLTTTNFFGTLTSGFASVDEPGVAVCLQPGTELAFEADVKRKGFWSYKSTGQTMAVFRQINRDIAATYHDALEFADGQTVLLTLLKKGQTATVLQLPAILHAKEAQSREEPVSA